MNIVYIMGYFMIVVFFIYNMYCYKRNIVIYTIKSNKLKINDKRYFNIQLIGNDINIVILLLLTTVWKDYNKQLYIIVFTVVFWAFNYLIRDISKVKKYIEYEE